MNIEIEETARLLLLEGGDSLLQFAQRVRDHHPATKHSDIVHLWAKYRGFDGRSFPTHDVETGEKIGARA